jgi:hypothetical protein
MGPSDLPRLGAALEGLAEHQRDEVRTDGRPDWAAWWDEVAADPALTEAVAERQRFFGGVAHPASFHPPSRWHVAALEAAGFSEAGVAWRQGPGAVVAAVR